MKAGIASRQLVQTALKSSREAPNDTSTLDDFAAVKIDPTATLVTLHTSLRLDQVNQSNLIGDTIVSLNLLLDQLCSIIAQLQIDS
jgi:hypothetical protein